MVTKTNPESFQIQRARCTVRRFKACTPGGAQVVPAGVGIDMKGHEFGSFPGHLTANEILEFYPHFLKIFFWFGIRRESALSVP